MKRIYHGNYFDIDQHGNNKPFAFRMEVEMDEKLNFVGTVWEDQFSGLTGKLLSVKGYIDEDHISFVKKYPCQYAGDENGKLIIDESKPGHEVIYDGYWDESKGMWEGEWEVEGNIEVLQFDMIQTKIFIGKFELHTINN